MQADIINLTSMMKLELRIQVHDPRVVLGKSVLTVRSDTEVLVV
jgi:hypothetical protein